MKRLKKCMLLLMLAVFTLGAALPVYAKTETSRETVTLYPAKDKMIADPGSKNLVYLSGYDKSVHFGLKSSKKTIADVTTAKLKYAGQTFTGIYAKLKKPGTTTISWKSKENGKTNTFKVILKVEKYVNPISSIKLGNTTIKGTEFKNTSVYKVSYAKFANKNIKVNITPAKGWSLSKSRSDTAQKELERKIEKAEKKGDYDKVDELWKEFDKLPQKPSFSYFEKSAAKRGVVGVTEHNGSSIKVRGGKGSGIYLTLTNKKTKQVEHVQILFQ